MEKTAWRPLGRRPAKHAAKESSGEESKGDGRRIEDIRKDKRRSGEGTEEEVMMMMKGTLITETHCAVDKSR